MLLQDNAIPVLQALANTAPNLEHLELCYNDLASGTYESLAACMTDKHSLRYLGLEGNTIDQNSAAILAIPLMNMTALASINLAGCGLDVSAELKREGCVFCFFSACCGFTASSNARVEGGGAPWTGFGWGGLTVWNQ